MELRVYVNGQKTFCPFDLEKFIASLKDGIDSKPNCVNGVIEKALNAATGGVDEDGKPVPYAVIEWLPMTKVPVAL